MIVDPQCQAWSPEEWGSYKILVEHVEVYRGMGMPSILEPAQEAMGGLLQYCFPWEFEE